MVYWANFFERARLGLVQNKVASLLDECPPFFGFERVRKFAGEWTFCRDNVGAKHSQLRPRRGSFINLLGNIRTNVFDTEVAEEGKHDCIGKSRSNQLITKDPKFAQVMHLYIQNARVYPGNKPFHSMCVAFRKIDAFIKGPRECGIEIIGVKA